MFVGTASDTEISSGGVENVFGGGTSIDAAIANGAQQAVSIGGVTLGTQVLSGGFEIVSSFRTAIATTAGSGAAEIVSSGGTALDTTVSSGGTVYGTQTVEAGGTGIACAVGNAGTPDCAAGSVATGGIAFTGGAGTLRLDSTESTTTPISGFAGNDVIDLHDIAYDSAGSAVLDGTTDVLTITEGGTSHVLQLAGNYEGAAFSLAQDADETGTAVAVNNVPCFAAGTRILTERGGVAVEDLVLGDRVMTVDGEALPIRWIGHRRVDCRRHPRPEPVLPVRVEAGAFGPGRPARHLCLSPDHAIYAEGILVPVKHLLNGTTLRQMEVRRVTYFHIELTRHAVILAENLPTESYLDTGNRGSFANGSGSATLHPYFGAERADVMLIMEVLGYAPLRVTGAEVERIRADLRLNALPRGHSNRS